jgi:hypothetical protein
VRRFGIAAGVAAVAVTLGAVACGVPGTGTSNGQVSTTTGVSSHGAGDPIIDEDIVSNLMMGEPDTPVRVVFGHHAAIYLLERSDPNYAAWLAVLQRSLNDGTRVRFAYAVEGPRLTLVEPAQ